MPELLETLDNPVRPSEWFNRYSDNQLLSATDRTFEYDDNGNLSKVTSNQLPVTRNFTYNYDNQLTQYTAGSTNLTYIYDALGNRIQKTSTNSTTKYIIDPNRALASVLAETDASGNIQAYYVYGLGLISKIEGSNAYFYQYDGLGSTVAITDSSSNLKNQYAYDDFGNLATNSTESISNPFKYVGKFGVMTDAPDLLYMRARYYSPSLGRFINKDPIGLAGGMNLYGYVGNNPINLIDPEGLQACSTDEFTRRAHWWEWIIWILSRFYYNWFTAPGTPDVGPVPPTHRDWPGQRRTRPEDLVI